MTTSLHPTWLEKPETQALIRAFAAAQIPLRFVGGCVRDSLMGRAVTDIDAATPARPEQVTEILEDSGIRVIPTGVKHGTVTAVISGKPFEITTLRRDVACDGRHAEVEYTDDWQADAARRDFTVNALYLASEGIVYDYFGGIADLKSRRIRFIGAAEQRIQEDYLRILRFFRFLATHGAPPADATALAACEKYAASLDTLSGERIQHEMFKLLAAPDPTYALEQMQGCGILEVVLHKVVTLARMQRLAALEAMYEIFPSSLLRLALLLRSTPIPAAEEICMAVTGNWKLSNAAAAALRLYATHYSIMLDDGFRALKKVIRAQGNTVASHLLLRDAAEAATGTRKSDALRDKEELEQALALAGNWQAPVFPINGQDLLILGIPEGKNLGEMLAALEEYWEASDYAPDRNHLLKRAAGSWKST